MQNQQSLTNSPDNATGKSRKSKNFGLDVMRAIGIVLVIEAHAYHLIVNFFPEKFLFIPLLDKVAFSFVLSGFLIGSSLVKMFDRPDFGWKPVKTYWIRRWLRTIPTYLLVITVLVLLRYAFTSVGFVFPWKHFLFLQNIWTSEPDPYYFYPEGWSLAVEEWFYFLFPAALLMAHTLVKNQAQRRRAFLAVVLGFILLSTALRFWKAAHTGFLSVHDWNIQIRKLVALRFDTLMFGVLAAMVRYYYADFWHRHRNTAFWIFIAGMALTLLLYPVFLKENFWLKTLYITQVGIIVMMLLPKLEGMAEGTGFWLRLCTWLSEISFCIYLLNRTPILQTMMQLAPVRNLPMAITEYVLYWVLIAIGATALHQIVERPVLRFRERF
ncbi:MAG: acyltransferase [Chitinophagales bacterium]